MRILFDTNVILDVLLDREPFARDAAGLCGQVERGHLAGLLGATTVTTIHYLACKAVGREAAAEHVATLLQIFEVAPVDQAVLVNALGDGFNDYEDAVLHEAARAAGATGIVTRNGDDFGRSVLPVFSPRELLAVLHAGCP